MAKSKTATKPKPKPKAKTKKAAAPVLRSLRSVIYQVDHLERARAFYEAALGRKPYFDEPYYVGFDVDGQELGLHPDISKLRPGAGGAVAYWRVDDIGATWKHLLALGAMAIEGPHDVGGGLQTAIVSDPCGNLVGLIQH
jgi:predicted enzyme related to lactoylglutathione lyase